MANKKLNQKLWQMADDLRGSSNMDILELRNYVLGIMFYKFISDKNEKLYEKELEDENITIEEAFEKNEYKNALLSQAKEELGYSLGYNDLFSTFIKQIKENNYSNENFSNAIMNFNNSIQSSEDFSNLFDDVRLNDSRLGSTQNEKNEIISKIMSNLNDIEHEIGTFDSDVLGDAYEYLISKFASNTGKKAGEFYTPQQVSKLLTKTVTRNEKEIRDIYDPAAGSGSLLLRVANELKRFRSISGQELNTTTYNLARMNMIIHGINFQQFSIKQGDTIFSDKFKNKKFDAIVANPPYGTKWNPSPDLLNDERFYKYGTVAPKGAMETSFLQHIEYHLNPKGIGAVLLPVGVLFRRGAENKIIQKLIDDNVLEAAILLPKDMFTSTTIPVIMAVLNKNKLFEGVYLIDASDKFVRNSNKKNELSDKHIEEIIELLETRKETEISKLLDLKTIKENEYNLNITKYIQKDDEEEIDIDSLGKDIKNNLKLLRELEEKITDDIEEIKKLL